MKIRLIEPGDNKEVAGVLRAVMLEMDIPKKGTAYEDKEIDYMFESYRGNQYVYYIIHDQDDILGGAGIAPLKNGNPEICELQKMYFSPKARGGGYGMEMITKCLSFAKEKGFKYCYIETMSNMHAAQKLYKKIGFDYIDNPMGDTGHNSCPIWMLKTL